MGRFLNRIARVMVAVVGAVVVLAMAGPADAAIVVQYHNPFVTFISDKELDTQAVVNTDRRGSTSVELVDVKTPSRTEKYTDSSTTIRAGSYTVTGQFDQEPRPGRLYQMQTCFITLSSGTRTCGPWVQASASPVHSTPTTNAATGIYDVKATLSATSSGERMDGVLFLQYGTTTAYGFASGGAGLEADRGTSPAQTLNVGISGLTARTTYHYKACYRTQWPNSQTVVDCGADRTFTTAAPSTAN